MSAEAPIKQLGRKESKKRFQPAPVLPSWYEIFRYGNLHYPKDTNGIFPLVGSEIVRSLQDGSVDLGYVAYSRLTPEQFGDLKQALVHAHTAFGIPAMPEGHAQNGQKEFSADFWLNGNWADIKTSVIRALAFFGATKHPYDMDKIGETPANRLAYELRRPSWWSIDDGNVDDLIQAFMNSKEYPAVLPTITQMYETAAHTLRTDDTLQLARRRKANMSSLYKEVDDDEYDEAQSWDYEWEIVKRMKHGLDALGLEPHGKDEASILFLNAVISSPRWAIKENIRFNRI